MWRVERAVIWLYIGASEVLAGVQRGASWQEQGVLSLQVDGPDVASVTRAVNALRESALWMSNAHGAAQLRVVISDTWLGSTSMPWAAQMLVRGGDVANARLHLEAGGHDAEPGDTICLDDAPYKQPRMALVFPSSLLDAIKILAGALEAHEVVLRSLGVHVVAQLRAQGQLGNLDVLALLEPNGEGRAVASFVRIHSSAHRVDCVATRPIAADESVVNQVILTAQRLGWGAMEGGYLHATDTDGLGADALSDLPAPEQNASWKRTNWRERLPEHRGMSPWLVWLADRAPTQRQALDLVLVRGSGVPRHYAVAPPGGRLTTGQILALGALLGALGWLGVQSNMQSRELAQGRVDALRDQSGAGSVATLPKETKERLAAVNQLIAHLNIPVNPLLRAIEPPRDIRVALLSMEASVPQLGKQVSGATAPKPTLKVLAESPTADDMTRYVMFLSARKPLTSAKLIRHDAQDTERGATTIRFSVDVEWQQ